MKKKLLVGGLILTCALGLAACGKKEEATETVTSAQTEAQVQNGAVADEVVDCVNVNLPSNRGDSEHALAVYNQNFAGESTDTTKLLADLNDTAIPSMERFIENLSAVETKSEEVQTLKDLYLACATKEYQAMKLVASAIEGENADYLTQADSMISEANDQLAAYKAKLSEIAAQNNITIKLN